MNNSGGEKFIYFLAGAGIGAAVALLFAPKAGTETREILGRKAQDSRDYFSSKIEGGRRFVEDSKKKVTEEAGELIDKSKEVLQRQKDQLAAAFEAGKQAYREDKGMSASSE